MNGNKIIVHTLIETNNGYLVTKRSTNETTFPEYWDIPGGLVEYGELPREGVIRETKEEVGLDIVLTKPTRTEVRKIVLDNYPRTWKIIVDYICSFFERR